MLNVDSRDKHGIHNRNFLLIFKCRRHIVEQKAFPNLKTGKIHFIHAVLIQCVLGRHQLRTFSGHRIKNAAVVVSIIFLVLFHIHRFPGIMQLLQLFPKILREIQNHV